MIWVEKVFQVDRNAELCELAFLSFNLFVFFLSNLKIYSYTFYPISAEMTDLNKSETHSILGH